jgi:hypothetical protein
MMDVTQKFAGNHGGLPLCLPFCKNTCRTLCIFSELVRELAVASAASC